MLVKRSSTSPALCFQQAQMFGIEVLTVVISEFLALNSKVS
jgi:hypothetical protein